MLPSYSALRKLLEENPAEFARQRKESRDAANKALAQLNNLTAEEFWSPRSEK